jgi:hypothetical protein
MPFGNAVGQGFTNPEINEISIVELGPDDGLFFYEPEEGAGNLVGSISFFTGTAVDKYGNIVYPGFVSYQSNGGYTQLNLGVLNFYGMLGLTTPASIQASTGGGFLEISSGLINGGDTVATVDIESAEAAGIGGQATVNVNGELIGNNGAVLNALQLNGQNLDVPVSAPSGPIAPTGVYSLAWANSVNSAINLLNDAVKTTAILN